MWHLLPEQPCYSLTPGRLSHLPLAQTKTRAFLPSSTSPPLPHRQPHLPLSFSFATHSPIPHAISAAACNSPRHPHPFLPPPRALHARLVRPPTHSISPCLWASAALAGHLDLCGCGRDCAECGSGRQAGMIGRGERSGHWH